MGYDHIWNMLHIAESQRDQAQNRINEALELHYRKIDSCAACGGYWPCLTYEILTGVKDEAGQSEG